MEFVWINLSVWECLFLCSFPIRHRPTELHRMTLAFHHKEVGTFDEIALLGSEDGHLCSCSCVLVWRELHPSWILFQELVHAWYITQWTAPRVSTEEMGNVQGLALLQLPPSLLSHLWRELQVLDSRKYRRACAGLSRSLHLFSPRTDTAEQAEVHRSAKL